MSPWMRKLHKWVGLLLAAQFLLWMASGVVMSMLDADLVHGQRYRVKQAPPGAWPAHALPAAAVLGASGKEVSSVASGWLLDLPVYRLASGKTSWMVGAVDGKPVLLDAALASRIAAASYSGSGHAATPRLLERTLEARGHQGRVWRVDFADSDNTTVYVSDTTGAVLEHRNSTWRLFDFFWMLHIMDYAERTNFNNPLLVSSAVGGLWMALTGVWLLFASVRLPEFVPRRWRRLRQVRVLDQKGGLLAAWSTAAGDTAFQALARNGMQLPSNCGGGQSCGLCEVRCLNGAPPPTSADRALLSEEKIAAGFRLACNLPVDADLDLEVADRAALGDHDGVVTAVRAVSPYLREVTIRPLGPLACRPGSYIQLHVPAYVRDRALLAPQDCHADWDRLVLPERLVNDQPLRRSYSLALPVDQSNGQLTLLVRLVPGPPAGKGSAYVHSLREGEPVRFSGPFGQFALRPGPRDKIFIGGGAGMAPLRAMLHQLLAEGSGARVEFWYGARTLRDAPYLDEMAELARRHPNFAWHLVLSEDAPEHPGVRTGLVHEVAWEAIASTHPRPADCDFYLCGPPPMLSATRALLKAAGVSDERVAFDDFKI